MTIELCLLGACGRRAGLHWASRWCVIGLVASLRLLQLMFLSVYMSAAELDMPGCCSEGGILCQRCAEQLAGILHLACGVQHV